jgi:hypothetical protein
MMSSSATFKIVLSNIVVASLVAIYMSSADQQHGDFKGLRKLQVSIPAFDSNAALGSIAASVNAIGTPIQIQTGAQVQEVLGQLKAAQSSFIPGNIGDGGAASLNSNAANLLLPNLMAAQSGVNSALFSVGASNSFFLNPGSDNGAIGAVGSSASIFIPASLGSGAVAGSIGNNAASILAQSTP